MPSPAKRGRNESSAGGTAEPENQRVQRVDGPCNAAVVAVQGVLTCQAYPPKKTGNSPETVRKPWIL